MLPRRYATALLAALVLTVSLPAQEPKAPTAEEVKALHARYLEERGRVVKGGAEKRFLPTLLNKADEMAKKGEAALEAGRLRQASEAFRQARWQLPYQPRQMPEHVARVIGSLRLRHSQPIYAVSYSVDGQRLATASADETVKLWDLANGHELLTYTGHDSPVRLAVFSPDGKRIASADATKDIKVWDAETGKDVLTIKGQGEYVTALAWSRDGKYLVAGFAAQPNPMPVNVMAVFDASTGQMQRSDADFRNRVSSVVFSEDGKLLAVGVEDGQVRLWQYPNLVEGTKPPAYWSKQHDTGAIYAVAFSPDGKTLVCSGADSVKLYNTVQPGAAFQLNTPRMTLPATSFTKSLAFSRDGKTLFTGSSDGVIRFWDPESGQPIGSFKGHSAEVRSLAFNPAGSQLASASYDFTVRLWDFDVVLQARDFAGHEGPVWSAGFSPDGGRLVSAAADKTIKVWDVASGKAALTLTGHTGPVTMALFSPDGSFIASAGGDKTLRLWDAKTGQLLKTCEGHTATITTLDISPDSKLVATGGADRRVKLWDAASGKEMLSIDDNPSIVAAVAFHPNGRQLAVGNIDQTIALYDAGTGKLQHRWHAHAVSVNAVAYSPDGQRLASGGSDQLVRVWSLAAPGTDPVTLAGHAGPVSAVAFRKDGQHLASCGADQLVKLWKLEAGSPKELQTFRGHKDWVTSAAFSRDGHYVLSASVDRRLKIWEITSREIPLQAEHTSSVETVAVSPDGKAVVSGSADRTIKLWDRASGVELQTLHGHTARVTAVTYTPDGKTLASSGDDRVIRLWDLETGKPIPHKANQTLHFNNLVRSSPYMFIPPEGKRLFAWYPIQQANVTSLVHCYDLESGDQVYSVTENNRKVNSLAFGPTGKQIATGAQDGTVRIWKLGDRAAQMAPGGDWALFDPKVGVADLALTADGSTLVVTSDKGEIKVCDIAKREVKHTVVGHKDSRIIACIISPDGKRFATVGYDNVVKVWDLDAAKELRQWVLAPPSTTRGSLFVQAVAFTPDNKQLVTANANTTLFVLDVP